MTQESFDRLKFKYQSWVAYHRCFTEFEHRFSPKETLVKPFETAMSSHSTINQSKAGSSRIICNSHIFDVSDEELD